MVHNFWGACFPSMASLVDWMYRIYISISFYKFIWNYFCWLRIKKERWREGVSHVCVCVCVRNLCAHAHLCFHTHMCISLVDVYIYVYVPWNACMPSWPNPSMWTSWRENNCMHHQSSHFKPQKSWLKCENPQNEG